MDDGVMKVLKDKPIIIPRILLNNYRLLEIDEIELVIIVLIMSFGDKVIYDPEKFSIETNISKLEIMKAINDLIEKNIISLVVEKNNNKTCEYLSLEILYDKLYNIVISKKEIDEIDSSVFSTFENELGRTLSPMEYEKIKEWITSGNSEELITCALREAVMNGVGNFSYIDGILNNWKKKGYKNKIDTMKDKNEYRDKHKKKQVYETDWLNE